MLFDTLLSQIVGFGAYSSICSGNKRKALSSEDRGISSCCCVYGSNTGRLKPRRCFACSSLQEAWLLLSAAVADSTCTPTIRLGLSSSSVVSVNASSTFLRNEGLSDESGLINYSIISPSSNSSLKYLIHAS